MSVTNLTETGDACLVALARGELRYTVAGFANADDRLIHYSSRTVAALERRGFAIVIGTGRCRVARLTDAGRAVYQELCPS